LRVWPEVRDSINAKGRYRKYAERQIVVQREREEEREAQENRRREHLAGLERELDHFRSLSTF